MEGHVAEGTNWNMRNSSLIEEKYFFTMGEVRHQSIYQNEPEMSVFGGTQNLTERSPEQPVINKHALSWDVGLDDFESPSNLS